MPYEIVFMRSAEKALERLPATERARLLVKISDLEGTVHPAGARKLKGHELWRIRSGSYRAIYAPPDENNVIRVLKIAHRQSVYCLF